MVVELGLIFTLKFTTNLSDANYSVAGSARETSGGGSVIVRLGSSITTSTVRIFVADLADVATDPETCTIMIVR
jgi:hypothetical protein